MHTNLMTGGKAAPKQRARQQRPGGNSNQSVSRVERQRRLAQSRADKMGSGAPMRNRTRPARRAGPLLSGMALAGDPTQMSSIRRRQFTQQQMMAGALRNTQFAPRGHGYYDAFANPPDSAAVSQATGPATSIAGVSIDTVAGQEYRSGLTINIGSGGLALSIPADKLSTVSLVLFNPGASNDQIGTILSVATNGTITSVPILCSAFSGLGPAGTNMYHDTPHINSGEAALTHVDPANPATHHHHVNRRVESIPLRGSIRFRNITEARAVGGTVKVLRYNGGVELHAAGNNGTPVDPGLFSSLISMIRDSPRTRCYTGSQLREPHQLNSYPCDFVRSMSFHTDVSFPEALAQPAYSTLMFLIDEFSDSSTSAAKNNTYEFSCSVQKAARFPIGTLLHSMAKEMRVHKSLDIHAAAESTTPPKPVRNGPLPGEKGGAY